MWLEGMRWCPTQLTRLLEAKAYIGSGQTGDSKPQLPQILIVTIIPKGKILCIRNFYEHRALS